MRKLRVGILFGGRSGEHEVSVASAASVMAALNRDRYEPIPLGITRSGTWLLADSPQLLLKDGAAVELPDRSADHPAATETGNLVHIERAGRSIEAPVDVIFPLLHGPFGEDGTVQGVFETAGVPYVGSGVAASAVGMDKVMMKHLLTEAGLPGVPYVLVRRHEWQRDRNQTLDAVEAALTYPVFVKPCNMGSSVGISKGHNREELAEALAAAARYDRRIIVEQGVDARELECGVLGNDDPLVSVVGEVVPHNEFYDYHAKYTEGMSDLRIPAPVSREQEHEIQDMARRAFLAIDGAGLARVDFFLRRDTGEILVNEINTMPGFTATSMYPMLWEASGVPYSELIDRLIQLALQRFDDRQEYSVTR